MFKQRTNIHRIFICMAIVVFTTNSRLAMADTFDDALEAYQEGEYSKAGELWKKAGEKKNEAGESFYNVGLMYRDGVGYEQNLGFAAHWLKQSAARGYAPAMYALGEISYFGGENYPKNLNAALYWWDKGIDLGEVNSMLKMADLYIKGEELQRDLFIAQRYLNTAKQSNSPDVELYLYSLRSAFRKYDVKGTRWISKIRPDVFTIEYYAARQFSEARRFAIANDIQPSAVYQTLHGDYILMGGLYETIEEAYAEIQGLSDTLYKVRPRPRSISVIQAELVKPTEYLAQSWITQRDPNDYTVLLYGAESLVEALDFVDLFGLSNASVFGNHDGYFGVVAGVFDSTLEASDAVNQLPDSLKYFQPRPVLFNNIQQRLLNEDEYMSFDLGEHSRFFLDQSSPSSKRQLIVSQIAPNVEIDITELIDQESISADKTKLDGGAGEQLTLETLTVADVVSFIYDWKKSWEIGNFNGYIDKYVDDFIPADEENYSRWKISRERFVSSQPNIDIQLQNIKLSYLSTGQIIMVSFDQSYRSEAYESDSVKILQLELKDNVLDIVLEKEVVDKLG